MTRSRLLSLVVLGLMFALPMQSPAGEVLARVVAVVNSDIVTSAELEQGLAEARAQGHQVTAPEMLDALIEERLIDREAERRGITIRPEEIEEAITRRREALGISEANFTLLLEREGMTMTAFRHNIEQGLRRARLIDMVIKSDITISDEELATFYSQNAEKFLQADEARVAEFFISASESLPAPTRTQKRTQLNEYRRRIVAGENFAALAQKHSDGATAAQGGDLGFLNIAQMKPEFRAAALGLSVGDVSQVIESAEGFHLLTITETRSGEMLGFGKVRKQIYNALFQEKSAYRYEAWVMDLRAAARVDIRL